MSAIAGIIDLPYNEKILHAMEMEMICRGPDGHGLFMGNRSAMMHFKLLTSYDQGGQPVHLHCGKQHYIMVYDGTIYNIDQLRGELAQAGHICQSECPEEVIIRAYIRWKEECAAHFRGNFALAIWEEHAGVLFLARDQLGIKPLFYMQHGDGLLFASEIKMVLTYPGVRAQLDIEGVSQIVLLGPGRAPGSGVFHGIKELEPGCCALFRDGKMQWKRYWKLTDREHTDSFEQTAEKVRRMVTRSIKEQLAADVPVGTFLSGGLDSSIVTAVYAQSYTGAVTTFSLDYEDNSQNFIPGRFQPETDNAYIDLMQSALQTNHHWTVLGAHDLADALEEATVARDLPGMGDVDFSLLAFAKEIRKYVKVALSGECADELFGGYPWFRAPDMGGGTTFPWAQNTALRETFLQPHLRNQTGGAGYVQDLYETAVAACDILPQCNPEERRIKELVNLNMWWFMQTLLDRNDRMCTRCGLDVRAPFCDVEIAEYMYGVPVSFKDYMGREKGLLRYAMEGLLPEQVLYRKKNPYPKTYDPRYADRMRCRLLALLEDDRAALWEVIDPVAVKRLAFDEMTWPWYGQLMKGPQTMAYILQIDYWLRHYKVDFLF